MVNNDPFLPEFLSSRQSRRTTLLSKSWADKAYQYECSPAKPCVACLATDEIRKSRRSMNLDKMRTLSSIVNDTTGIYRPA